MLNKDDKHPYQSPSTGDWCTPAQYIAEIMMVRAYNKKKQSLPLKFWNNSLYIKEYKKILIRANSLLKIYEQHILIKCLNENQWLYSLYYPDFQALIDKIESKQESINTNLANLAADVELLDTTSFRNTVSSKKESMRSKLRDE